MSNRRIMNTNEERVETWEAAMMNKVMASARAAKNGKAAEKATIKAKWEKAWGEAAERRRESGTV
jgi:hypothetical protein